MTSSGYSGKDFDEYSQSIAATKLSWVEENDARGKFIRRHNPDTLADTPWIPTGHVITFGWATSDPSE